MQHLHACWSTHPQTEHTRMDSEGPAETTPDLATSSVPQAISADHLDVVDPSTPVPASESWVRSSPSHHLPLPSSQSLPTPHHVDRPLEHHPTDVHSTNQPFKCPKCTRGYADISTLRWHMTKVHHLRMRTVQFDRARHALLGMPTCSLCHASSLDGRPLRRTSAINAAPRSCQRPSPRRLRVMRRVPNPALKMVLCARY